MKHWTAFHPAVFCLTFGVYALSRSSRRTLSLVKTKLIHEWTPSTDDILSVSVDNNTWSRSSLFVSQESAENFLGVLDAIFLFIYSLGLYLSGMVANRVDLRIFLAAGMALSAVVFVLFGPVLEWCGGYSEGLYVTFIILYAAFQSTAWPGIMCAMGNWFGVASRGLVLGTWSTSPSVGSIVGSLMVSSVVEYGYEYAFLLTSSLLLSWSVVVFFGLVPLPEDVGLTIMNDAGIDDELALLQSDHDMQQYRKQNGNNTAQSSPKLTSIPLASDQENVDESTSKRERILLMTSLDHSYGAVLTENQKDENTDIRHQRIGTVGEITVNTYNDDPSKQFTPKNQSCKILETLTGTAHGDVVLYPAQESDTENMEDNKTETKYLKPHAKYILDFDNSRFYPDSTSESRFEQAIPVKKSNKVQETPQADDDEPINDMMRLSAVDRKTDVKRSIKVPAIQRKEEETGKGTDEETVGTPVSSPSRPKAANFFTAILLPGIIPCSLAYACVKMVNHVFFFWLPFYLSSAQGWPVAKADQMSIWYDVGGVLGPILAGVLRNKLNISCVVLVCMLLLGVPELYVYSNIPVVSYPLVNGVMLVIMGASIGGASNLISTVISTDLGRQKAVQGSSQALSIVSGIIEGTGTLGAALGQLAVPQLNTVFGWTSVFYMMMAAVFLPAVIILRFAVAEIRGICADRQQRED